jgi:acyl-CoA thioester hydrolase
MIRALLPPEGDQARESVHRYTIVVGRKALDENGHVNNVQYVQWMQDAAVEHSDRTGCTRLTRKAGAMWVARSHIIEYLRPAFKDERITVLTWVSNWRKVRSLRKYRFVREADGVLLARGETDWVCVDATSGRPRNIPDEVAGAFVLVPPGQEP